MILNIHAGHNPQGKIACGAVGVLDESKQARLIRTRLIKYLEENGHTVYDCTVDDGLNQSDVLNKIIKKCNEHVVDLDISIHLNSSRNDYVGDGKIGGTECWIYPNDSKSRAYGEKIASAISATGITTIRGTKGVKESNSLSVLNRTKNTAILIEVCFVDDIDDVNAYNANKVAKAIYKGITGKTYKKVTVDETKTSKYPCYAQCTANNVNVRAGAGTNYKNISGYPKLNKGNEIMAQEKLDNGWYKVAIADRYIGYVHGDYVKDTF